MSEEKQKKLNVYEAISLVTERLAKEGITKDRIADTGRTKYSFRGIDDVYNALAPYLAEAGLTVLPFCLSREVVERKSSNGNALFYITVTMRFDFVSKWDGSKHEVCMYGEAMDSGDKATNKAMSAAFKYACMQAFCIPTEGDNDSENQTHEVKHVKQVFANAALRKTFQTNVISSFAEIDAWSETAEETLKTLHQLNSEKFAAMKDSGNEHDALALDEIRKQYAIKKQEIDQAKMQQEQLRTK